MNAKTITEVDECFMHSIGPHSQNSTPHELAMRIRELASAGLRDHDIAALTALSVTDVRRAIAPMVR